MTGHRLHVLGKQQLFHFICAPLQFLQAVCRNRNKDIHIIKILIGCQTILQEISGADGTVQIIKVRVRIGSILDFGPVDSKLLSQLLHYPVLWLPVKENIHINSFSGIY